MTGFDALHLCARVCVYKSNQTMCTKAMQDKNVKLAVLVGLMAKFVTTCSSKEFGGGTLKTHKLCHY